MQMDRSISAVTPSPTPEATAPGTVRDRVRQLEGGHDSGVATRTRTSLGIEEAKSAPTKEDECETKKNEVYLLYFRPHLPPLPTPPLKEYELLEVTSASPKSSGAASEESCEEDEMVVDQAHECFNESVEPLVVFGCVPA